MSYGPLDQFDLTDKVAVVTGGSRGLGLAIAEAYARQGAHVVIASRKLEACEAVAERIAAETGRDALPLAFHAGRWEDAERLVGAVRDRFGRCDVLVNNAGMSPLYESLPDVSEELFDKVVAVNLRGPFRLGILLGALMAGSGGGSIINVSSVVSIRPSPGELVYAGAKAALNVLTVGLAQAYAPSVRCNTLMPGPFLTDISKAWDMEQFEQQVAPAIPLGRAGEAHEVVGAALYLASDASTYTTGSVIRIDGGLSCCPT